MRNFFLRWIVNAVALYVAARLVPGIAGPEELWALALVALIFGVVNASIGPLLRFLTCPLIILTLGLFTFVINALLLLLTSWLSDLLGLHFSVAGFGTALLGALVVSLVSWALSLFLRDEGDRERKWRG